MPETWKHWEGQVVDGRFPLRQYLGGSDHSAVFLTDQGQGSDRAAIKLISASANQRTAQLRRWDVSKKLAHPHLLRLLHAGNCRLDGTELLYAVTEYAEENLSQILPDRPLTSAEARDLLSPVLEALTYIHSQGLVHGHLKPANILASGDQLKLAVDGLRAAGETGADVRPSIYVPPEIVSGGPWTPAADSWSLGVTLVEALTQQPPLSSGIGDLTVPKAMPGPFLEIAENCLVRDPRRRWAVAEITARLHPRPSPPEKPTITQPRKALPRKNPVVLVVAATVLLVLLLIGVKLLNRRSNTQPSAPAAESPEAPSAANSPTSSPTTKGGSVPGAVAERSLPDVPAAARNTIQGKVRLKVKVSVDSTGTVVGARLVSAGPSKYFANLALKSAQRWKFSPPRKDGQNATSEWILSYEFGRAGTKVQPAQTAP